MEMKKRLQALEDWIDSRCHKWEVTRCFPFLGDEMDLMIMELRLKGIQGIFIRHSSRSFLDLYFKGSLYKKLSVIKRVQLLDSDPLDKDAYKHFRSRFQIRLLESGEIFVSAFEFSLFQQEEVEKSLKKIMDQELDWLYILICEWNGVTFD